MPQNSAEQAHALHQSPHLPGQESRVDAHASSSMTAYWRASQLKCLPLPSMQVLHHNLALNLEMQQVSAARTCRGRRAGSTRVASSSPMTAYWRASQPACAAAAPAGSGAGGRRSAAMWPRNCASASPTRCWCSSSVTTCARRQEHRSGSGTSGTAQASHPHAAGAAATAPRAFTTWHNLHVCIEQLS